MYLDESFSGSCLLSNVNLVLLRQPKFITSHLEVLIDDLLYQKQWLILSKSGSSDDAVLLPELGIELS